MPIEDKSTGERISQLVGGQKPPITPSEPQGPIYKPVAGLPGYNKGTANVKMPAHGSFRGDKNGRVTATEHAGVPHPSLAPTFKKK